MTAPAPNFDYQRLVIGYHGCDKSVANRVLLGEAELEFSDNDHDWLGRGIYFWEHGPRRAAEWAVELRDRDSTRIRQPAVIGAFINLGFCFDLLDRHYPAVLARAYPAFAESFQRRNEPLPRNRKPRGRGEHLLRFLDCALINWLLDSDANLIAGSAFQTVRGLFVEGEEAFPGSAIHAKSHIQIAVRDSRCIVGYFRPQLPLD